MISTTPGGFTTRRGFFLKKRILSSPDAEKAPKWGFFVWITRAASDLSANLAVD